MSKTKCPKKGSPHQTSWGMGVIATGKCVGNKAEVVSGDGSVIQLAKTELKTVKGENRQRLLASAAAQVVATPRSRRAATVSTVPGLAPGVARIHADPAAAARYFVGGPRAAVVASGAMPAVVPQAASYAPAVEVSSEYMVPRWDPMTGQMRWMGGRAPAAVAMEPEMYSGGHQFFDGLAGIRDLSGSPEEHYEAGVHHDRLATSDLFQMRYELSKGNCLAASSKLIGAADQLGRATAHAQESHDIDMNERVVLTAQHLDELDRKFREKCVYR